MFHRSLECLKAAGHQIILRVLWDTCFSCLRIHLFFLEVPMMQWCFLLHAQTCHQVVQTAWCNLMQLTSTPTMLAKSIPSMPTYAYHASLLSRLMALGWFRMTRASAWSNPMERPGGSKAGYPWRSPYWLGTESKWSGTLHLYSIWSGTPSWERSSCCSMLVRAPLRQ